MTILGKRIKNLRENKNLNQKELAKILNISNTTLSQYENGQRIPSDDVKISIAKHFDCSIDFLLGNSEIKNPYGETVDDTPTTIAAHATQDLTEEEQQKILDYVKFIKSQRKDDK